MAANATAPTATVLAYDSYGRPIWNSGEMSTQGGVGGIGNQVEMLQQHDANISQAMQGQFVNPITGQLMRQPLTPGQAAAAGDGLDAFAANQQGDRDKMIMSLLGAGGYGSSYGSTSGSGYGGGQGLASGIGMRGPGGNILGGMGVGHGSNNTSPIGANGIGSNKVVYTDMMTSGPAGSKTFWNGPGMNLRPTAQQAGMRPGGYPTRGSEGYAGNSGGVTEGSRGPAAGGGATGNFRSAFESELMKTMQAPGIDPEPIINKGTEEIAEGEKNAQFNLDNKAASMGVGGGAVSGANREILSDFAGKRADLARTTRVDAALSAQNHKLGAMNAASNYYGKLDDNARADRDRADENARADRNMLMSYLMNGGGSRGGGGGGGGSGGDRFSGLMSQAGQNGGLAFSAMAGGSTRPKGPSTYAGGFGGGSLTERPGQGIGGGTPPGNGLQAVGGGRPASQAQLNNPLGDDDDDDMPQPRAKATAQIPNSGYNQGTVNRNAAWRQGR
jgi:hypothetical protein